MKKLLLILLLVLAGEISAQQAATIVVKTKLLIGLQAKNTCSALLWEPKHKPALWENLSINSAPTAPAWCRYGPKGVILLHST